MGEPIETRRDRPSRAARSSPEVERIGAATVTLPLYPDLGLEEQDCVIAAVTEILRGP